MRSDSGESRELRMTVEGDFESAVIPTEISVRGRFDGLLRWGPLALALIHFTALVPLALQCSEGTRMAEAVYYDEGWVARRVETMIATGSLNPHWHAYGELYFHISALPSATWHTLMGEHPESLTVIAMRLIHLLSASLCILLTARLGRRIFDPVTGLIAALLFATVPMALRYATIIHPDFLQLVFLLLSLDAMVTLVGEFRWRQALICSVWAGLATAIKFGGVFLGPALCLTAWVSLAPSVSSIPRQMLRVTVVGVMFLAVVALLFAATSPHLMMNFGEFTRKMVAVTQIQTAGHFVVTEISLTGWITLLSGPRMITPLGAVLALLGIALSIRRRAVGVIPLLGVLVVYLSYLSLRVNFGAERYLFPLLPHTLILTAAGIRAIAGGDSPAVIWRRSLAVLTLVAIVVWQSGPIAVHVRTRMSAENSPRIQTGLWARSHLPHSALIWMTPYVYVPPEFEKCQVQWSWSEDILESHRPDALFVSHQYCQRFLPEEYAERYRGNMATDFGDRDPREVWTEQFLNMSASVLALQAGSSEVYVSAHRLGYVEIFIRRPRPGEPEGPTPMVRAERWFEENISPDATVWHSPYLDIPPDLHAREVWMLSRLRLSLTEHPPDFIALGWRYATRFGTETKPEWLRLSQEEYAEERDLILSLRSGQHPGMVRVFENDAVEVFARQRVSGDREWESAEGSESTESP
jgi:4-amino-4-deoxy-L-arabinose transferase-like glycosyltransferase